MFDCMEYLILEFYYQIFRVTKDLNNKTVSLIEGVVDLELLTLTKRDGQSETVDIKRSTDNRR